MSATLVADEVLQGDCRAIMASMPAEGIDMAMFSPPYFGLRDYGAKTETVWGGKPDCQHRWSLTVTFRPNASGGPSYKQESVRGSRFVPYRARVTHSRMCKRCGAWMGQLGLEPTWQMYVEHLLEICRGVRYVLKRTGSLYIVLGDTYAGSNRGVYKDGSFSHNPQKFKGKLPPWGPPVKVTDYPRKSLMGIPWRFAFRMIDDGWCLRNDIIWYKPNGMPSSVKDRLSDKYEHIFHFVLSDKTLLWRDKETGRWVSEEPSELHYLDDHGNHVLNEKGEEVRRWFEFDYYFELDAIREPHQWMKDGRRIGSDRFGKGLYSHRSNPIHPKGKNPGDVTVALRKSEQLRLSNPFIHHEDGHVGDHPLGKNPGDVLVASPETRPLRAILGEKGVVKVPGGKGWLGHWEGGAARIIRERDPRWLPPKGKNPGDFWPVNTQPFKGAHFAAYPEGICVKPIRSSCPPGGLVLDPMCGSGTTLIVAAKEGCHYLGIDISPDYVEMAKQRLRQRRLQGR